MFILLRKRISKILHYLINFTIMRYFITILKKKIRNMTKKSTVIIKEKINLSQKINFCRYFDIHDPFKKWEKSIVFFIDRIKLRCSLG